MSSGQATHPDYTYVIDYYLNGCSLKLASSVNEQVFQARLVNANSLLAEALMVTHGNVSAIESIRTWIARSHFRSAQELIQKGLEETTDPNARADFLLDQARICFFEGDWCTGVTLSTQGLELDPIITTRMALFQVRASCFFELGEWQLSQRDASTLETLGILYGKATTLFLSRMTQAKIAARVQSSKLAHLLKQRLWQDFESGKMMANRDHFIGLCRLEIDLARVESRKFRHWAVLCALICHDSGDRLFEALAILDLACESDSSTQESLIAGLQEFDGLKRIELAQAAIKNGTTEGLGITMAGVLSGIQRKIKSSQSVNPIGVPSNFILCKEAGLLISRNDFSVTKIDLTHRSHQILLALAEGGLEKGILFEQIYQQKYVPHLHDKMLRNQISRTRKELGVSILCKDGTVTIESGSVYDVA